MELEGIVARVCGKFKLGGEHCNIGLEFLLAGRMDYIVGHKVYRPLTEAVMEDELQFFYRLAGIIPVMTSEGPIAISSRKELSLLRAHQIGIIKKEKRFDTELFRLYRRVAERHRAGKGPSVGELIDQLGSAGYVRRRFRRSITYDDVLRPVDALSRYMAGEVPLAFKDGKKGGIKDLRIRNFGHVRLLSRSSIYQRKDTRLIRVDKRVEAEHKNGGPNWTGTLDHAGRMRGVAANLGRIAVSGDATGRYNFGEYVALLTYYALNMPLQGAAGGPTIEDILNLHEFSDAYKNTAKKRQSPTLLDRIFRGINSVAWKNRTPTARKAAEMVFQNSAVVKKYGRTFSSRQLDVIAVLKQYADRLEGFMLGEQPVNVCGLEKTISSIADMRFLVSFPTKFLVSEVQTMRTGVSKNASPMGIRYYDLLDAAGARPRVVEMYGRPITRTDANPRMAAPLAA